MLLVFVGLTGRLNATFHSQSWERREWKSRYYGRREEEENADEDKDEGESILDGSEDIVDGFKSVGECMSFPHRCNETQANQTFQVRVGFSVT